VRAIATALVLAATIVVAFFGWGWIAILAGTCPAAATLIWLEKASWQRVVQGALWVFVVFVMLAIALAVHGTFD
jgi:hypothetical protein